MDWHTSGSLNSKDKTVFGFVTPRAFCRQVWFSLSTDLAIKPGPLLSLRQAIHLDTNLSGWGCLNVTWVIPVCRWRSPANLPSSVSNCPSLFYVILPAYILLSTLCFGGLLKKAALAEGCRPWLLLLTRAGCTAVKSKVIYSPFKWHVEARGESLAYAKSVQCLRVSILSGVSGKERNVWFQSPHLIEGNCLSSESQWGRGRAKNQGLTWHEWLVVILSLESIDIKQAWLWGLPDY